MITDEQKTVAVKAVCDAVISSVEAAGKLGAPGGIIYAALMAYGLSFDQYNRIMDALVRIGKIERRGQLYFTANLQSARRS